MSKQRRNKKINYTRNTGPKRTPVSKVRLSQCMIVKNEEKNIEKALSWAKDIAFEQIVVDTGSTDRTVEIAERLGAKVFHFEWIDDFSAAKNYAIEQAKGNWIAFLDADEYLSAEDARKLMKLLEQINGDARLFREYAALRCPLVNLDSDGKPFLTIEQIRVFRNKPDIRYANKIHEGLTLTKGISDTPELSIIHTGYTKSALEDTGKAERNITMLENELAKNPDDAMLKCFLAESLAADSSSQDTKRAEALFTEALSSGQLIPAARKHKAYLFLSGLYDDRGEVDKGIEINRRAVGEFPDNPDFHFALGVLLYKTQDYKGAWDAFISCEELLKSPALSGSSAVISNAALLFFNMLVTADKLGKSSDVVHYAALVLREDKNQKGVLTPLIKVLTEDAATSDDEIFELLAKLYDFGSIKDKLMVARAVKDAGNAVLAQRALSLITPAEREWMSGGGE